MFCRLDNLLDIMPSIPERKLVSSGVGVWLVWSGQLSPAVAQILREYGGLVQTQEVSQALWFFFGEEVFRALGRLMAFAKVNTIPLFAQTMPASLLVGHKFEAALALPSEFAGQEAEASMALQVLIHPQFRTMVESVHGLSLEPFTPEAGLARADFLLLAADVTLTPETPLSWFFVLRPLGDPLDKATAEGWRGRFQEMQNLVERLGIKYLSHDGFLIFAVDNLRDFRKVCRELLAQDIAAKQEDPDRRIWPCVMAAMFKKGLNFNKDIPKRFNLDWNHLTPDYPHMSFRSALYLGKGYRIGDVRQSTGVQSIDDWCQISLTPEEGGELAGGEVAFRLPSSLLAGRNEPCFYCGLAGHAPKECPSKTLATIDPGTWEAVAMTSLDSLQQASDQLKPILADGSAAGLTNLLRENSLPGLLIRGVMEGGWAFQPRTLAMVWRSQGKYLPEGLSEAAKDEGEYMWSCLDALRQGDWEGMERELARVAAAAGRGLQPRSLQGFLAMEQGDWTRAPYFWQEAARGAITPLQRAYLLFLEGRGMEVQGEPQKAVEIYRQARAECPRWQELPYRQGVCMVNMGFNDQGIFDFMNLIREDPRVFNRILLDPELERGRPQILAALWKPWTEAKAVRDGKCQSLADLPKTLKGWFREDHPFLKGALERAQVLSDLAGIDNYVAFVRLVQQYDSLQRDLDDTVDKDIAKDNRRLKAIHEELKDIHYEAAWFPFNKLLREFNADFNSCATKLNWMRTSSLRVAANFRKAQDYLEEMDATLTVLKARLVTLRIVRDATLFVLLLGKSFLWMELVGLAISLLAGPVAIYLAQKSGATWLAGTLAAQKWQLQQGLFIILSITAMALAALKTALSFEKKRSALFATEEARLRAEASKTRGKPPAKKALASPRKPAKAIESGKGKKQ